jgi:hypothetical protein
MLAHYDNLGLLGEENTLASRGRTDECEVFTAARNCSPDDLPPYNDDVQALRGSSLFRGDYQEPLSVGVPRELYSDTVERTNRG